MMNVSEDENNRETLKNMASRHQPTTLLSSNTFNATYCVNHHIIYPANFPLHLIISCRAITFQVLRVIYRKVILNPNLVAKHNQKRVPYSVEPSVDFNRVAQQTLAYE